MDNKISPYDSLIGNELIKNYMGVKLGFYFHKEWGWLMPVVNNIQKEGYGFHTTPHG